MEVIRGRTWKFGDNMNTDLMLPNIAMALPESEQPKHCFSANRPGWSEQVKPGDIIVGGENFGTGSNRLVARVFDGLGLVAAIAESINGLFFRNCLNYGFPAIVCPGVSKAFEEGDEAEIDIGKSTVKNVSTGEVLHAEALPPLLLNILEAGGVRALLKKERYLK